MRAFLFVLVSLLLFSAMSTGAFAATEAAAIPDVSAKSAILIELESGDVIYEYNADSPLPMASTTKIMTALLAIENRKMTDTVCVSPDAVGVEGSSVYLTKNEKLTMSDLVYALMLESANDAAAAIAIEISGSVAEFAELMNARAQKIGCDNTHFDNPHGLDGDTHYTTARDLAKIAAEALSNDIFREVVSTERHTIPLEGGGVRLLINHNRLLREIDSVIGVKTGFTKKSGRCLVTAAEKDGVTVVAVTLSDPDDWRDHRALLSHGLDAYECHRLAGDETVTVPVPVVGGEESFVIAVNESPVTLCLPKSDGKITSVIALDKFYFAPVEAGSRLGHVRWYNEDGDVIAEVSLIAQNGVARTEPKSFLDKAADFFGVSSK